MKKCLIVFLLVSHSAVASKLSGIQKFLHGRPAEKDSEDFLEASRRYRLDWRLLPAIAMAESGGGSHCRYNNYFGWKSGKAKFRSPAEGIFVVARSLSESPIYRGRPVRAKLEIYNPRRKYPARIQKYMRKMKDSK